MKTLFFSICAALLALAACTEQQEQRAEQNAEQTRRELNEAGQDVAQGARDAAAELNEATRKLTDCFVGTWRRAADANTVITYTFAGDGKGSVHYSNCGDGPIAFAYHLDKNDILLTYISAKTCGGVHAAGATERLAIDCEVGELELADVEYQAVNN